MEDTEKILLEGLTERQSQAVKSLKRRILVIAGAGSGKTEVMARRIAWWVGIEEIPKEKIIAFTFTERAAEEMKFRIRRWLGLITPEGEETALGGMYIGTIHGFCIAKLREYWPDSYHNFDILDESSRTALILREFHRLLGLKSLSDAIPSNQYATLETFVRTYDLLHEYDLFDIELDSGNAPQELGPSEKEWCKKARLLTDVGDTPAAVAFAVAASRYYAYIRCRRFLDFSTSQTELVRRLRSDGKRLSSLSESGIHLVVDEIQDINQVQKSLIELLVGEKGKLTAVGDHRQAIYGFRGAKVEITGELWEEFTEAADSEVIDLEENFRSTPKIIDIANRWADTIGGIKSMTTALMKHGNEKRLDHHKSHIAMISFDDRKQEAKWISKAVRILVPSDFEGALHDKRDGSHRGLTLSDVAILLRSSTDARTYMETLESSGIPCIVQAGPDLFSQPEVLLLLSALAVTAGISEFVGSTHNPKSLPERIKSVLGDFTEPEDIFRESAVAVRRTGLSFRREAEDRVLSAARAIRDRIAKNSYLTADRASVFRTPALRNFLISRNELRRVFPQRLYHMLLSEAEADAWDTCEGRGQSALFHLGALSGLITGIETPGWTSSKDYHWQIIGLCQYGAEKGRVEEEPLMVKPDAVSICTIHAAKGLEFAAVFLADINDKRFPSIYSKRKPKLPLSEPISQEMDIDNLADNANYDGERRLMYVALTRSERFLFLSHSGNRVSGFVKDLEPLIRESGGIVTSDSENVLNELKYSDKEHLRDIRLATSFSDMRYYLECPHDFYLRKVLGFSPAIDQAFGYGRGIHNLMRAIHLEPKKWSDLAKDKDSLRKELQKLIDRGLFYLRYTTGEPADNMRAKGVKVVADYVERYASELSTLTFEPEKAFETLIEYEDGKGGALVSGAIDIIRRDDPPQVTIIDFKSGDPESDTHQKLDEREMQLQVALYAAAAKRELEYQPEKGIVRYLGAENLPESELSILLDDESIIKAKETVSNVAKDIRDRKFKSGPMSLAGAAGAEIRCEKCDFTGFCGIKKVGAYRDLYEK